MNYSIRSAATNPVVLVLIVALGLLVGYFYAGFIGVADAIPPVPGSQDTSFLRFKDLTLNFSVLDTPQFSALKIYGESPVQSVLGNRMDIFNP